MSITTRFSSKPILIENYKKTISISAIVGSTLCGELTIYVCTIKLPLIGYTVKSWFFYDIHILFTELTYQGRTSKLYINYETGALII